jgi:C-terminal processing protease CtpA/Prc
MAIYNDNDTDTASDDEIVDSNEIISLTKEEYNENPIYSHTVINVGPEKAGYLMYNGFVNEYNEDLNQVFGEFKSQNIDHLILDLRYNSGGSIQTASLLGSMITGQFNNQIFTTLKYNDELQSNNVNYNFTNNFNNDLIINNLNLNKVYIITSNRSASASEMMINSLKCYIDVIQIGDETVGKSQASTILYDSPNLSRNNVNSSHTYAILPLIAITVNKNDEEVPSSGIVPEISIIENPKEYGIIGDSLEPILELVLAEIQGFNRIPISSNNNYSLIYEDDTNSIKNLMYVKSASNK